MELYRQCRPTKLQDFQGQAPVVSILKKHIKNNTIPHVLLFHGPSGTGKTTLARILANGLASEHDITEINCADARGIDDIREIRRHTQYRGLGKGNKVWILDEVVQMPKITQQAALKMLEDPPKHVYYILCTTDVSNLLDTVKSRCCRLEFKQLTTENIQTILSSAIKLANTKIPSKYCEQIASLCNGSGREALQIYEQILSLTDEQEMKELLDSYNSETSKEFLGYLLLYNKPWTKVQKSLQCTNQDSESIRRGVLGYCNKILLSSPDERLIRRAYQIANAFEMDTYSSGMAGITIKAYELTHSK